jgi:Ca2+-binding RTX toxin-like protein
VWAPPSASAVTKSLKWEVALYPINDILVGGASNDTLTGAGGRDIFDYGFKNAGNDTITDFTLGNTKTNTNADTNGLNQS